MGEWKKAWSGACEKAGLKYRWHDLRHTFVTRIAENPMLSEETIKALAGHVSTKMLERYSHIRVAAKQTAIEGLGSADFVPDSLRFSLQSGSNFRPAAHDRAEKYPIIQ
jgi:hypothetical protein